jgi:hypothetical protein
MATKSKGVTSSFHGRPHESYATKKANRTGKRFVYEGAPVAPRLAAYLAENPFLRLRTKMDMSLEATAEFFDETPAAWLGIERGAVLADADLIAWIAEEIPQFPNLYAEWRKGLEKYR